MPWGARTWKGRPLRSSEEAVTARLAKQHRGRIMDAARRRFWQDDWWYLGLYAVVGGYRLTVTPRTHAAAGAIGGDRGEDMTFRVQYDEKKLTYTFYPIYPDDAARERRLDEL